MTMTEQLNRLQGRIGYEFQAPELLLQAMTHSSYANEQGDRRSRDNERLEFLGDAVLDLAVAAVLLSRYPAQAEGVLTRMRAELVAEPGLARLARQIELGSCLLLGRGEERSGGRKKASLLADALEALFGAIYLDGGYDKANQVIVRLMMPFIVDLEQLRDQDFKTNLQEYLQGRQQGLPEYRTIEVAGPAHQRRYKVDVSVDGTVVGTGEGRSKKKAEQAAASAALVHLKSSP